MAESLSVNREFKDRLFKFIFGNPERKEWTLWLFNALNHSNYTNADEIEFNTLDDAIYMSMKNDVSFLLHSTLNFYEQQSSLCPNMPIRFLEYAPKVYSAYIQANPNFHIYSSVQQYLPAPRFVCFYNGRADQEDSVELKLSTAFGEHANGSLELVVEMININYGHNQELLEACRPLKDYSYFVAQARHYMTETDSKEEAVDAALSDLPDDSVIKPYLLAHRAEVKIMCITEYDEEKVHADFFEDGFQQGIEQGIEQGFERGDKHGFERGDKQGFERGKTQGGIEMLVKGVSTGLLTTSQAAALAEMTEADFMSAAGL